MKKCVIEVYVTEGYKQTIAKIAADRGISVSGLITWMLCEHLNEYKKKEIVTVPEVKTECLNQPMNQNEQ